MTKPLSYDSYLRLSELLSCQSPKSDEIGRPAHDEMLFIIIHQVYELWFKQILTEVDSVVSFFKQPSIDETVMDLIVARLQRVVEIQKLLVDQIRVLETMTPLDFLEFRDLLFPSSGFQSFQFRVLEVKLGLQRSQRLKYNHQDFDKSLSTEDAAQIRQIETSPSLFTLVERWLERTPFLNIKGFDFWSTYQKCVADSFRFDEQTIIKNAELGSTDRERNLQILKAARQAFDTLFDEQAYERSRTQGEWTLSYRAIHAALLIQLYRDQPVLQLPFRLLTALIDIDEWLTTWRYRHSLMVRRMLGSKIGTGGSSGYQYLRDATEQHKIFRDFFQLTTFFIPRSKLPALPPEIARSFGFQYTS